jgi:hypothetical protein
MCIICRENYCNLEIFYIRNIGVELAQVVK